MQSEPAILWLRQEAISAIMKQKPFGLASTKQTDS